MYKNNERENANEACISRKARAGVVVGCLTLSMLPAMAFAAPAQDSGPGQAANGQQPMQMSQDWQAPQGEAPDFNGEAPAGAPTDGQAPEGAPTDGQAPEGAPADGQAPDTSQLDSRIISAISDEKVKELAEAGNPDTENLRPAIPEGEVNVQQLLDEIRQMLMESGQFSDLFNSAEADGAQQQKSGSNQQFAQMPNDIGVANGDATASKNADANAQKDAAKDSTAAQNNDDARNNDDTSGLDLFKSIIESVKSAFGL